MTHRPINVNYDRDQAARRERAALINAAKRVTRVQRTGLTALLFGR